MWLVFKYTLAAVRAAARERRELALENIALRHQVEVLTRSRRRPQLRPADRLLWSSLSRVWPSWRRHVVIVQPDTVVRWHRTAWRRYWRWKSRGGKRGRPRIGPELAELIRRMTRENPRWGHMRVLGELRKLGFHSQPADGPSLPEGRPARPPVELAHVPGEPPTRDLGVRLLHGAHALVPDALRLFLHRPRPQDRDVRERHGASDCGVGVASADRRDTMGDRAALLDPGSGPFVRW